MGDGFTEDNNEVPPEPEIDVTKLTQLERAKKFIWDTLDDPSSSKTAQYVSAFVMTTILLSIAAMTFSSIPEGLNWVNVWVDNITGEVFTGSMGNETFPNLTGAEHCWAPGYSGVGCQAAKYSDSPSQICDEVDEARTPFAEIEVFCITIFTAEYVLRAWAAPAGPGYLAYFLGPANLVDLVSILPFYMELLFDAIGGNGADGLDVLSVLRLIRLTRITRVFKMSKNFQGLVVLATTFRKSAAALLMLFLFMLIFSILFATLIYTFEGGSYDEHRKQYVREDGSASPFESIPVSMWWTIVTMCTVGYGDQYPVTPIGKVIAILTMFCGLIVLSLPITIIGANFNIEYRNLMQREQREAKIKAQELREKELQEQGQSEMTDAIHLIHELIEESHETLKNRVFKSLVERENRLREQLQGLLVEHSTQVGEFQKKGVVSPLEVKRSLIESHDLKSHHGAPSYAKVVT